MCNSKCGKCGSCVPALIAKILVIVGGLNWGLVGVGMFMGKEWNLVYMLLGSVSKLEALVYVLVGLAAVMSIFGCKCKKCMGGTCSSCGTDAPASMEGKM
ncbi:DUF378 domain-containing protein [Candidatus Nomurabacteria bacterium]|nr:DUF378 domain-containing protein [Candidatus Nomurabacteria bacterium]